MKRKDKTPGNKQGKKNNASLIKEELEFDSPSGLTELEEELLDDEEPIASVVLELPPKLNIQQFFCPVCGVPVIDRGTVRACHHLVFACNSDDEEVMYANDALARWKNGCPYPYDGIDELMEMVLDDAILASEFPWSILHICLSGMMLSDSDNDVEVDLVFDFAAYDLEVPHEIE